MLQLADRWIWDFWFTRRGREYHVFYLQAPRRLGDPDARHAHATIGHAVSADLRNWTILPDALGAGPPGAWDDLATWTGSVLEHTGRWWMFYTGGSVREAGAVQRIGLATSEDLITWIRHERNPLLSADVRWYERHGGSDWHEEAWRDPWVFADPAGDGFVMFLCARVNHGPADGRGVVGSARSDDLVHWEAGPPVTEPGEFGHLEVPQLLGLEGRWYLLFSVYGWAHAAVRRRRSPVVTGTHYLVAAGPLGPYRAWTDEFLVGDPHGSLYAGRVVEDPGGRLVYLAFSQHPGDGPFRGELSDPFPVHVDGRGHLRVDLRV